MTQPTWVIVAYSLPVVDDEAVVLSQYDPEVRIVNVGVVPVHCVLNFSRCD